jgi:DNA-binding GntR family transcriptional regulator
MSRCQETFVPPVILDRASAAPLHRQIYAQLAEACRIGAIRGDARLPSSRLLARILGVSRNTVLAAYDELAADGLIRARRGSGTRLNGGPVPPAPALFGLRQVIRASGYPAKILAFTDPDGNLFYICH